jgi:uncharacterized protein
MTERERQLVVDLLDRLKRSGGQPKDREAGVLIDSAVAAQPDAAYLLVQTVLIQSMALENAQARIQQLERPRPVWDELPRA